MTTVQKAITSSLSHSVLSLTLFKIFFSFALKDKEQYGVGKRETTQKLAIDFVVPRAKQICCQIVRVVRNLRRFGALEVSDTSA